MENPAQAFGWMVVIIAGAYIALLMVVVCIELFAGRGTDEDKP